MVKTAPPGTRQGYENDFDVVLQDWVAQADAMSYSLERIERFFETTVRKTLSRNDEGKLDTMPLSIATSKLTLLRALERIIDIVGLGDRRHDLLDRFSSSLWPSPGGSAGPRRAPEPDDPVAQLLDVLRGRESRARRKARRDKAAPGSGAPDPAARRPR